MAPGGATRRGRESRIRANLDITRRAISTISKSALGRFGHNTNSAADTRHRSQFEQTNGAICISMKRNHAAAARERKKKKKKRKKGTRDSPPLFRKSASRRNVMALIMPATRRFFRVCSRSAREGFQLAALRASSTESARESTRAGKIGDINIVT